MVNTNRDEAITFTSLGLKKDSEIPSYLHRIFPFLDSPNTERLKDLYPNDEAASGIQRHNVSAAMSDYYFHCPARLMSKTYRAANMSVHKSMFTHHFGISKIMPYQGIGVTLNLGVTHGMDLAFWWNLEFLMGVFGAEKQLSRVMVNALITFGSCHHRSNPGVKCTVGGLGGTKIWPEYVNDTRINLRMPVNELAIVSDTEWDSKCRFLDEVVRSVANGKTLGLIEPAM